MAPGVSGSAPLVFLRRRPARGAIDGAVPADWRGARQASPLPAGGGGAGRDGVDGGAALGFNVVSVMW